MVPKTVIGLAGLALGLAAAALVLLPSPPRRIKPARTDCQIGPTTPGIDVSYYQETIDWQRVHRAHGEGSAGQFCV